MEIKENGDLFAPWMREQVEAFYERVEIDLFESERNRHLALCRHIAAAARARNDKDAASRAERRFARWDKEHTQAFLREMAAQSRGKAVRHG